MKSILIIDDEKEFIDYIGKFIEGRGFKVLTAGRGEEGVEVYRENKPDCVFLDLHLPEMDGMTVLKKIKELDPEAKVYLVTGDDSVTLRRRGESLGAKGYILKPLEIRSIVKILNSL